MSFRVVHQPNTNPAQSPFRIVEQATGREIDWVNRYLDQECLRRIAPLTIRSYAHVLLHFLRWWESVHHTGTVTADALTDSILLDYVRFQSSQQPPCSGSTINQRIAVASPWSITLCAAPSPIRPGRSLRRYRRTTGVVRRWAWGGRFPPAAASG